MKVVCYSLRERERSRREGKTNTHTHQPHSHFQDCYLCQSFDDSPSLFSRCYDVSVMCLFASRDNWRTRSVKILFVFWSSSSSMNFIAIHKKIVCIRLLTHRMGVETDERSRKNMTKNKWWTQKEKKRNLQISNIHSENESKMLISRPHFGYEHGLVSVPVCVLCMLFG